MQVLNLVRQEPNKYPKDKNVHSAKHNIETIDTFPLNGVVHTIWEEAHCLAKLCIWEYNLANEKFIFSDYIYKLLDILEGDPLDDLTDLLNHFPDDEKEVIKKKWSKVLDEGDELDHIAKPIGTTKDVWIQLKAKPVYEGIKLIKVVGVIQDVTECQEREKQLEQEKLKAEKATQLKSEFVSLMSHEIRTPLNAIMGLTYLLLQEENMTKERKENLQSIHFSSQNMLNLINNILDLSRIEAGKIELEKVNFNLTDLLKSIHRSLYLRASEKKLDFELHIDPNIPDEVAGDPARLTQIINNLTSNALKFTSNGSVRISVDVVYQSDQDWVIEFSVSDTGVGIPPEKQQLIFEHFVQASTSTHRQYGGTGLGLAITKKIVELHKGTIRVDSTPEKGSTFSVRLKYAKPQPSLTDHHKPDTIEIHDPQLQNTKILVIDDNAFNKMVASKLLLSWQADVDTAENGKEALEKIMKDEYDLVLMDLHMPLMNGFEAIAEIRKSGKTMPIIALTANSCNNEREKTMALGGNDYISKPFVPQDLYNKLLQHVKCNGQTEAA